MNIANAVAVNQLPSIGDLIELHESLPFDGRTLHSLILEEGVQLQEIIDGEAVSVYVSYTELMNLVNRIGLRK